MKRFLLMAVAATAMLTACEKTEMVPTGDAQEISFVAVNKTATKVPVNSTAFGDSDDMAVAAYIVEGTTKADFFGYTLFGKSDNANNWTGQPARYWPLTSSKINFLAVTEKGGNVDNTSVSFGETSQDVVKNYAKKAIVKLSNNAVWSQNDLMFAVGQGIHTQGEQYSPVTMVFKHALSWINFTVKTETTGCTIKVNSITLNEAVFNGELTLSNGAQYNSVAAQSIDNVGATWSCADKESLQVPNSDGNGPAVAVTLNNTEQTFGNGLLVVPDGYAKSFTINYTLTQSDNTANTFDYTYTLPTGTWEMAKKYFYNINITLREIEVTPSITDWNVTSTSKDVELNGNADTQVDTPANN